MIMAISVWTPESIIEKYAAIAGHLTAESAEPYVKPGTASCHICNVIVNEATRFSIAASASINEWCATVERT